MTELRTVSFGAKPRRALFVDGRLAMVDVPSERLANDRFAASCRGDVIVCGLGLGLFVKPLLENPAVRSVLVVEQNYQIVNLMRPELSKLRPRKPCDVLVDDAYVAPIELAARQFIANRIHFDIWSVPGRFTPADLKDQLRALDRLTLLWSPVLSREPGSCMTAWLGGQIRTSLQR